MEVFGSIIRVLIAIVALGILVFVHELGHFIFAKLNRVGVYEFAIGFGKKILRRRIGKTYYSIGSIPLGGYVSMAGDDPSLVFANEPEDASEEGGTQQNDGVTGESSAEKEPEDPIIEAMLKDESGWLLKKGYLAKLSVVVAGPLFNIFFAIFASIASYSIYGMPEPTEAPVIGSVLKDSVADKGGLKAKDRILRIDGTEISSWTQLADTIAYSGGKELTVMLERMQDGRAKSMELHLNALLDTGEMEVLKGEKDDRFRVGISPSTTRKEVTFLEASKYGPLYVWNLCKMTIRGLAGMVKGAISPKNLAGPIFIFSTAAETAKKGVDALLGFMIFLSVSLAILNILPIPILDGGHVVIFTIESIFQRPLSLKIQQRATQVGLAILLLLTIFAVSNDIVRLFS